MVVASVTGTEGDPQDLKKQVSALEAAGVEACESNAAAARRVVEILKFNEIREFSLILIKQIDEPKIGED